MKYLDLFYENATIDDKVRIKALSNNGATSWLNAVPNDYFGTNYSNQQYYIILSLFFGCELNIQSTKCKKCKQTMDKFGHHSLHCTFGGDIIKRHNKLRDVIDKYLVTANFNTKKEQRYTVKCKCNTEICNNNCPTDVYDENKIVNGIPGDIKVFKWDIETGEDIYLDVVIGNVFASSYINGSSKERLYVAKKWETRKRDKYNNKENIEPLAFESMGGMGSALKLILQRVADKIAIRQRKHYGIVMNGIRTKLTSELMRHNNAKYGIIIDVM